MRLGCSGCLGCFGGLALVALASIMAALFVSIFWLAAPIMDGIRDALAWAGSAITSRMVSS